MIESSSLTSWYFLSIYYSQDQWNCLLRNGVIPFVSINDDVLWTRCILHFGFNRGPYVGLSCQVPCEKKTIFFKDFEKYFTSFLRDRPSKKATSTLPHGLYMDFPSNTICHSLHSYSPAFDTLFDEEYQELWHKSTKHLLSAVNQGELDTNDLFTAGLYLNLLLLLSNSNVRNKYLSKCHELFKGSEAQQAEHITLFRRAENELREILSSCMLVTTSPTNEPLFIYQWFDTFNAFLEKYQSLTRPNPAEAEYGLLTSMLFSLREQLGVRNQTLMDYFLYQLLFTH